VDQKTMSNYTEAGFS